MFESQGGGGVFSFFSLYVGSGPASTVIVGNPNRKKMHILGFVGIFEYIC